MKLASSRFAPERSTFHKIAFRKSALVATMLDMSTARRYEFVKLVDEMPLKVVAGDKLKMLREVTGFHGSDGTTLYEMRNEDSRAVGLIPSDLVAMEGTIECET